mmetsp:Transcript_13/g.44  ORF Transcript_13/g.44 Transcript_13/m.44 type:complete len:207 (+) Transcript_13:724-1344(+)
MDLLVVGEFDQRDLSRHFKRRKVDEAGARLRNDWRGHVLPHVHHAFLATLLLLRDHLLQVLCQRLVVALLHVLRNPLPEPLHEPGVVLEVVPVLLHPQLERVARPELDGLADGVVVVLEELSVLMEDGVWYVEVLHHHGHELLGADEGAVGEEEGRHVLWVGELGVGQPLNQLLHDAALDDGRRVFVVGRGHAEEACHVPLFLLQL